MSVFEAVMLLCFGAAWPFSIARSVKSKSTHGKSLVFLLILIAGYISGIINKILYSNDIVLYLSHPEPGHGLHRRDFVGTQPQA